MLSSFSFIGSIITLGALAGIIYLVRKLIHGNSTKTK